MATSMKNLTPFILMAFMITYVASSGASRPSRNKDIVVAMEEMQMANYFTFVLLLNMAPPDLFQGNVTFLMPNDRSMSRTMTMTENTVVDFLVNHSIPSPLLFDQLLHLPTNTMLPTSDPKLMLKVSNNGRNGLFLSNVKVISPNICTAGNSVRCHGIDGVVMAESNPVLTPAAADITAPPFSAPPLDVDWSSSSLIPSAAPHAPRSETSSGSHLALGWIELALTCMVFQLAVELSV